jgi:pyruvate dehydrogenase E1 component alpha subunit
MLGANGIVGAGYAIAAGAALTAKVSGNGRVSVVFFGDGAVTRGTFHEVMNMASLWKLPLILVCENNGLAQYVPTAETMVFESVSSLAPGYKMSGMAVDGNDVRAVHEAAVTAVEQARLGHGPSLLELHTQRYQGHSSGDPQVYRTKAQVEALRQATDPVVRLESELLLAGLLGDREEVLKQIDAEVAQAVTFAEASPFPSDDELSTDVYA